MTPDDGEEFDADRLARLRGDASTDAEIARTSDLLRGKGVIAPGRMIAMLVPGLMVPA
jgi:hypothetical protein